MPKAAGFTHDNKDNTTVDWYTPSWIFEELGLQFDLDPAAPEGGVPWIPATNHYALPQNGLGLPWEGRVWLNPPYGRETPMWLEKMAAHRNGVALVFARTDCQWFHGPVRGADALLLLKGRIKFVDGFGVTGQSGAGAGSMLVAWGDDNANALLGMQKSGLFIDLQQNRALTMRRATELADAA